MRRVPQQVNRVWHVRSAFWWPVGGAANGTANGRRLRARLSPQSTHSESLAVALSSSLIASNSIVTASVCRWRVSFSNALALSAVCV